MSEKGFAKPYAQGIDFPSLMSWQYADRESLLRWTNPDGKNYTHPEHTPKDEQSPGGLLAHCGKGPLDIVRACSLPGEQGHAQCWGCGLGQLPLERVRGVGRIQENGDMQAAGFPLGELTCSRAG